MQHVKSVALALLVVASVVAGVAPVGVAGTASAAPSGFVGVPDGNVDEDMAQSYDGALSAEALRGEVLASSNASTLEVIAVTSNKAPKYSNSKEHGGNVITEGDAGIILRDDVNHAGRDVGLPVDMIRAEFGYVPQQIHGLHENGSRWTSATRVVDGSLIFEVPHFSTQTVAFESEVHLTGSEATGSTSWRYNITDSESVENVSTTLTGVDSTEVDTVSTAAANGDTLALDVAGTDPATNVEATLTGSGFVRWDNHTASGVLPSSSQSLGVDGNLEPQHSDGGDPKLTVTASESQNYYNPVTVEGDGAIDRDISSIGDGSTGYNRRAEVKVVPDYNGEITEITVDIGTVSGSDYGGKIVDVYLVQEAPDTTAKEGTKIASWDPQWSTGEQTISVDSPPTVSSGTTYTLEFVTTTGDGDGTSDYMTINTDQSATSTWMTYYDNDGTSYTYQDYADVQIGENKTVDGLSVSDGQGNSASFGDMTDGETLTKRINLQSSSSSLDWGGSGGGSIDYTLEMQERAGSEDPSMDVDGDGTADVSYTGVLMDGETTSAAVSDLAVGASAASVSLTSGTVDASVTMTEHTVTQDVTVSVNGVGQTHSGTLSPGSTATLTHADGDVVAGENVVDVGFGTALSADAPAQKVGVDYGHDAASTFAADVAATKWEETHNVSRTLPSDRDAVTYTLPFSSDVVALHSVETRTNPSTGGSWSSVSSSSYSFDGTNLTVDTGSATEGDVVEVRATARRVVVENGEIAVQEPTVEGDDLNTLIEVTSKSAGFHIRTQNTSDRLHYLGSKSWTGEPYAVAHANGNEHVHMPGASVGSTARIRTLPMQVNPSAGAIEVVVESDDATRPRFRLRTGNSVGAEDVQIVYNNTVSGQEYRLWSVTQEREVMADTAESPVFFWTDGDDETYLVEEKDGTNSAAVAIGGNGDGGGALPVLALFAGIGLSIGLIFLIGRKFGASGSRQNTLLITVGAIVGIVAVEAVTPRSLVSDLVFALGDVLGAFASSGAGAVLITFALLLLLYVLDSRLGLPLWVQLPAGVLTVLWLLNELTGFLGAALDEMGPLLILVLAGGSLALLYRALKGPTFKIVGRSGP